MDADSVGPAEDDRAWPDRQIAALAARQATVVSHAQLRALGVASRTISAALARGRLHRVHHGVHSLVPAAARPRRAPEHAALLACGPYAVLSHRSAADLHGLRLPPGAEVELTVVGVDRGRRRPGLRIHRTQLLHPGESLRVNGLPATAIARTVVDLAPQLSDRTLEHLLDEALKRVGRRRLREAVQRHRGRPGVAGLGRLLDPERPSSDTWSIAEERLLRAIRSAGLPAPEVNVPVGRFVPDFLWREMHVIVEFDSYVHHSGPAAFQRTWDRHAHFQGLGYAVLHVTWRDLAERCDRVIVRLAAALVRSGWAPE